MKGIFVVPVHNLSREDVINIDLHTIKENFDLLFRDVIRLDFPNLNGYSIKYCSPTNTTVEMLSNIPNKTDNIDELVNRASLALVDYDLDVYKFDYIILIFRVVESNSKLVYNQKNQTEMKKFLSNKYKIAKNKIKIFNYEGE